ncbi:MAG: RHS repeat-associated core domain-containing protein [Clostridiales bacterium]|nr:RHS repeat-associated core domain-containing protein [Clostridiales bacterium]
MGIIKIRHKNNKDNTNVVQDDTILSEQSAETAGVDAANQAAIQDVAETESMDQIDIIDNDRAVISEDESQTTDSSRLYYLNNGTAVSVISASPSNFFDEEARAWKKIDTTLTDVGDEFESVNGAFKTRISKAEKKRSIRVGKKDLQVMWEFKGKQRNPNDPVTLALTEETGSTKIVTFSEEHARPVTTLKVGEKQDGERGNHKRKHRKLYDRAVYNNIEDQTDLEYCIYGDHIKENIIVKEKSDYYRYVFALQTQGLKMRLSEDNLQIELYRESDGINGAAEQTVEFTIPAPYMYDASGERCEEVYYELEPAENGQFSFAIVASAEWINAENRVLPVTIDPQIVMDSNSVITKTVEYRTISMDSCLNRNCSAWSPYSTNKIEVASTDKEEKRSTIKIKKSALNLLNKRIARGVLYLTNANSSYSTLLVDGYSKGVSGRGKLEIDLTSKLKNSGTEDITIVLTAPQGTSAAFTTTTNAPYILIEYLTNENIKECKREIDLVENVKGVFDIATGEFTPEIFIASGDGLSLNYGITQIFKQSSENFACGDNFRLNLHEELKQYGGNFIYTDMYGIKHGFTEHFYYFDENGDKKTVEKWGVSISPLGEMSYEGKEVFREEVSDSGLRASTQLQGISGIRYFEQRQSEIKQLEDQIQQYKDALEQFVVVNTCMNKITYRFKNNLNNLSYSLNCSIVLTESEAYSLLGMQLQRDSMELQDKSYEAQDKSLQYAKSDVAGNDNNKDAKKKNYDAQISINNSMRANTSAQKDLVVEQLENLPRKSAGYQATIEQYYREYLSKKAELEVRKRLTPVHYIMAGELIKGFNEKGELVAICDQYNNTIAIERDSKGRIVRVYDEKEKQIVFKYNYKGLLSSVTDVRGKRTAISRPNGKTEITYSNSKQLTLSTSKVTTKNGDISYINISEIILSDKSKVSLTYDRMLLTGITYFSLFNAISHGKVTSGINNLSTTNIAYSPNQTVITTSGDVTQKETFKFDVNGNLSEYYVEKDNKVVQAEKYDYEKYSHDNVQYAQKDSLNKKPLSSFAFVADEFTNVTLNKFNSPISETTGWKVIHKAANGTATKQKTETTYTYDDDRRVIMECSVLSTQKGNSAATTTTAYKKYSYNAHGSVVRTESYVDGEELTSGKTIEETVYDDKGRVVKSFTYNSLDASSKFYTESETDEDGRVVAEIDETGENKTRLEYVDNSDKVCTQTLPNGGKFSYGYDIDDNVAAITQSTDEGEANSTQTEYTNREITKLTSGNNTVKYSYDKKLRKTAVYLNSDNPYVSFTYLDQVTENSVKVNKVTSKLINGDTAVSVSDMHGNVLNTSYNGVAQTVCEYDADDKLTKRTDKVTNAQATFAYDTLDHITKYQEDTVTETYAYNDDGNISTRAIKTSSGTETYSYAYNVNASKDLQSVTVGSVKVSPKTDVYGRNTGKEIAFGGKKIAEENIYYRKVGDHATNLPVSMRFGNAIDGQYSVLERLQYKYDECGNIIEIRENGVLQARYAYDKLNRIVREDNKQLGKTWLYSYDNNGNILCKREFDFTLVDDEQLEEYESDTILYGYDGDRLMSFGELLFKYDVMGNPTMYCGKSATWANGRQLVGFNGVRFAYDGQGRRISKNGIKFTYDSNGKLLEQSNGLSFIYDNSGIVGLKYKGSTYIYRKDIQGNIIAILDSTGNVVVEYVYSAWGNHAVEVLDSTCAELSQLNPFRYRGYYYDTETGLYFLKTRYYDPEIGRFITIDDLSYLAPETINGLNLYAYCGNSPVMNVDPNGNTWQDLFTCFERIFTGISDLCKKLAKDTSFNAKKFARQNKISYRAAKRYDHMAGAQTESLGKTLGKVANVLAYATLAIDIGVAWYDNYKSGNPDWVSASVVDTIYIGARFAIGVGITALCSLIPIPIIGTGIGIGLSILADYLITNVMESWTNWMSTIKSWAADVGNSIKRGWNNFTSWLHGLFA